MSDECLPKPKKGPALCRDVTGRHQGVACREDLPGASVARVGRIGGGVPNRRIDEYPHGAPCESAWPSGAINKSWVVFS